jgi:GMP synthase (glutamine-hydrolysing)
MAVALGGTVYPGTSGKEIGWSPLTAGPEAAACPALSELFAPGVQVLHWHGDTFDVPPGAAHLASSRLYPNQAFAVGHARELGAARINVPELRAAARRHAPLLQEAARRLWRRWLDAAV